ncbi:MAG: tetratricopeptide repeat protein [Candidatus Omnitrophota bacterium]
MRKKYLETVIISGLCLIFIFSFLTELTFSIETNEGEDFYVAAKAFEDGFYDLSLDSFQSFIKRYPSSSYLAQAQFFVARCLFFKGKFADTLSQLQALLANPATSNFQDAIIYWIAEVHLKGKDYTKASLFYQKVINEYPKSEFLAFAYYSKGICLFELEKFSEAADSFNKIRIEFPKHSLLEAASFKSAESLYRALEYEKAQEAFKNFNNDFPKNSRLSQSYFFLAEISFYTNNYNNALKLYQMALDKILDDSDKKELKNLAIAGIGWCYLKQNKIEEAKKIFIEADENDYALLGRAAIKSIENDFDGAITAYARLIEKFPGSSYLLEAFLGKAEALYNRNSFEESVNEYKMIIEKFSRLPNYKDIESKVNYGLAWSLLKSGQFQSALNEFEKIAKFSNDDIVKISALCQMADTYQEAKEYDKARQIYDKILTDYPNSLYSDYVQFQIAATLYKSGSLDAAIFGFRAFLDNFPKTKLKDRANYYLGLIYFQQANYQGSIDQLNIFLVENKDSSLKADALYLLASSFYNLGQYKQAVSIFERIFKENIKKDESLSQAAEYEIANCLYQLGKEKDALARFNAFLRKHPQSNTCADIIYWLGEYYMRKDNFEVARRYFRKVLNEYPVHELFDSAQYNIAISYLKSDRLKAALAAFSQVTGSKNIDLSFDALLSMADIYIARKEYNLALGIFENLLSDSKYASYKALTLSRKADLLKSTQNYPQALAAYKEVLQLSSEKPNLDILFKIAELEEERGKLKVALEYYLKISYLPGFGNSEISKRALLRSARICEAENEWEEAKKIYQKLKNSNFQEAKYASDRLDWIEKHIDKK